MEQLQAIVEAIVSYIPIALTVVGAFAAIAAVTPNKSDDKIVQFLLNLVNFVGANVGKAKNKEQPTE